MGKFSINKIIRVLIGADFVFLSALGLITPIFAVFITGQIKGGTVEVVGFAAAIYWIAKSLMEIPIGKILDKIKGERDDVYFLVIGYMVIACVQFGYMLSSLPWHIYVLEGIYAFGTAMAWPAWAAIFTRHIDRGKEGFEWSVEHVAFSFGTGITGAIGGILAVKFGFNIVFLITGFIAMLGGLLPLFIIKDVKRHGDHHLRFIDKLWGR
jgi:MFS family permease